jgi:hypothetical protein
MLQLYHFGQKNIQEYELHAMENFAIYPESSNVTLNLFQGQGISDFPVTQNLSLLCHPELVSGSEKSPEREKGRLLHIIVECTK